MLFENNNYDFISFVGIDKKNEKNIFSLDEGFSKGNMFPNEYKPYKNYKPGQLKANNPKDEKLYKIMALNFAINDLNLYLDLHPNKEDEFQKFKHLLKERKILEDEFVKEYGPLKLDQVNGNTFNWVSKFPWEKDGGSMYV